MLRKYKRREKGREPTLLGLAATVIPLGRAVARTKDNGLKTHSSRHSRRGERNRIHSPLLQVNSTRTKRLDRGMHKREDKEVCYRIKYPSNVKVRAPSGPGRFPRFVLRYGEGRTNSGDAADLFGLQYFDQQKPAHSRNNCLTIRGRHKDFEGLVEADVRVHGNEIYLRCRTCRLCLWGGVGQLLAHVCHLDEKIKAAKQKMKLKQVGKIKNCHGFIALSAIPLQHMLREKQSMKKSFPDYDSGYDSGFGSHSDNGDSRESYDDDSDYYEGHDNHFYGDMF